MKFFQTSTFLITVFVLFAIPDISAQALRIPGKANIPSKAGRTVGVTEIEIRWNAPGVKGREGKIWGTEVAYFGTSVLGFGSDVASPWRAGADECTTMSFSTDVTIQGKKLAAGKYGFFMELHADSVILIFNKNTEGWGSYFYNSELDVLRVTTKPVKNRNESIERLEYTFGQQTDQKVEVALEWEYWKIPFIVETNLKSTTLAHIQTQMSGALGFDPPSLQAAASWCLENEVNFEQALKWITSATDPNLGGAQNFNALSTRSGILKKMGKTTDADKWFQQALDNATIMELHIYGRQLIAQNKPAEAMAVFEKNYSKNAGKWPTLVGMMRGHSATGNLKKALEFAKLALVQAPDDLNKKTIESAIKTLESGKAL